MEMFSTSQRYRTFLTVLLTYALDLVGFSIVFPVLAPLLLNTSLHFFSPDTGQAERTTVLGIMFAVFGITQFFGAPLAGALADHYGRYKVFLWTIALSVFGYGLMAWSVYSEDLTLLFLGRIVTGFCSGNFGLAQSATADLTAPKDRGRAFGILMGVGGLGFVAGPWIGGKLANPDWLYGSGAFIFAAVAAAINFLAVYFFFIETWVRKQSHTTISLFKTIRDIQIVFRQRTLRIVLTSYLFFSVGWAFFLIFSPTYLVQRFSLKADQIGDIFAYMSVVWFFASVFLNKELGGKFSHRSLVLIGAFLAACGVALFLFPGELWPYWIIIPVVLVGGALAWVNLGSILSLRASDEMQGRALGVSGSMWSMGQIIAPLVAGPLAGWNIYSPLLLGSLIILISFLYFVINYRERSS